MRDVVRSDDFAPDVPRFFVTAFHICVLERCDESGPRRNVEREHLGRVRMAFDPGGRIFRSSTWGQAIAWRLS